MKLTYNDFNKLDFSELVKMEGIGKTTAKRIIAFRPFREDSDLFKIKGLGSRTLAKYGIEKKPKRKKQQTYLVDGELVIAKALARNKKTGVIDYFWRMPKEDRIYL